MSGKRAIDENVWTRNANSGTSWWNGRTCDNIAKWNPITLDDTAWQRIACDDYNECGCESGHDGHCMYCLRPKHEHTIDRTAASRAALDRLTITGIEPQPDRRWLVLAIAVIVTVVVTMLRKVKQ